MAEAFYRGQVQSALKRARKILRSAGVPMSRKIGRYTPFCNTQTLTIGASVHQVGCSESIALHYHNGQYGDLGERRRLEHEARDILRAGGLPFDDRGWLLCLTECYRCKGYHRTSALGCRRKRAEGN